MDIIGKKYIYFTISLVILIPGIIAIALWGLNLSIDFTGGSRLSLSLPRNFNQEDVGVIRRELSSEDVKVNSVERGGTTLFIRTAQLDSGTHNEVLNRLEAKINGLKEEEFETIGPSIGRETTINTFKAILLASFLIVLYITWSFRQVPKPASSLKFGICAIIALIHDVLIVVGIFAILGHFLGVEIDTMFFTAILTIIGFSVHDTIVVFDRIRENLRQKPNMAFSKVVNFSIIQTLGRSLNTSLTVIVILVALLFFGGITIKWFVVALLAGIISGTYSSIFNASPLLVVWHEWSSKKKN